MDEGTTAVALRPEEDVDVGEGDAVAWVEGVQEVGGRGLRGECRGELGQLLLGGYVVFGEFTKHLLGFLKMVRGLGCCLPVGH